MGAPLPAGWSVRPPTLADIPAILAVVHASDVAAVGEADFTADEVLEILTAPNHDMRHDSWVVTDATRCIVGWAYIENALGGQRENFDAYVDPLVGGPAHAVLIDLVLARVAARARLAGAPSLVLRGGAIASERRYIDLLESAGFAYVKRYARMRRTLDPAEGAPESIAGVTVRPVRPDDEAELRTFHEVLDVAFRDTPDYRPSSYETYRARLDALPGIDWDEWFVAQVDDVVAAILQSSTLAAEENEGWIKYLAVRREYRGRGLGRLLLGTAFHTYAGKGRRAAGLGVDLTNPTGAYRLYESVGMTPVYEADIYERVVTAA